MTTTMDAVKNTASAAKENNASEAHAAGELIRMTKGQAKTVLTETPGPVQIDLPRDPARGDERVAEPAAG